MGSGSGSGSDATSGCFSTTVVTACAACVPFRLLLPAFFASLAAFFSMARRCFRGNLAYSAAAAFFLFSSSSSSGVGTGGVEDVIQSCDTHFSCPDSASVAV